VFELWDTRNARLVGRFASESEALDAAYHELRADGRSDDPHATPRPHLSVSRAGERSAPDEPRRWARMPSALRGLTLKIV
jgi:hypothetical protein